MDGARDWRGRGRGRRWTARREAAVDPGASSSRMPLHQHEDREGDGGNGGQGINAVKGCQVNELGKGRRVI